MRLDAIPTTTSSVGKKATNKLNAMACEIMLHRGKTRAIERNARLLTAAAAIIDLHYTERNSYRNCIRLQITDFYLRGYTRLHRADFRAHFEDRCSQLKNAGRADSGR